jgi:hypothetical protein
MPRWKAGCADWSVRNAGGATPFQNGTVGLGKFRRLRQCVIDQGT